VTRPATIVIPAHGRPDLLRALLERLDRQAAERGLLEVLVSDDATPRPLAASVDTSAYPHLGLRIVRSEVNGGPGAARNRALELVQTPWVAFVDADELPTAGWLDRLETLLTDPDAPDVVVGRVAIPAPASPFQHATEATAEAEQYVAGNIAFRTAALRRDGGFDERFYDASRRLHFREDAELRFRLESAGRTVGYHEDLVVEHPPLPSTLLGPARLARRYYFDPLLSREYPERFRAFVRMRRVGPVSLRRARHDAALLYGAGVTATAAGAATRRSGLLRAGAGVLGLAWLLNFGALAYGKRMRPRHVPGIALLATVTPLVYLWHFYRGVIAFRHHPRW
jgi:glycosyltransferase involved in cell wall biosynthesis